jgi:hypothetical protein
MLQSGVNSSSSVPMPIIMACTNPSKIMEMESAEPIMYDPISQIVYNMRIVGTYSLKNYITGRDGKKSNAGVGDKKNEIDDQKNVK